MQDSATARSVDERSEDRQVCTRCGGANVHFETVRSAFWEGERLVVVDDIPALVCADCREQFYDDATVMHLDFLRGQGFPQAKAKSEMTVPVFSLRGSMISGGGGGGDA